MPAKRPIRRSQLISPWGVGQMINFPKDESLMVAGLDLWEERFRSLGELNEFVIEETRLAQRLRVVNFRLPPDYRDPAPRVTNPSLKVPVIRFPRWHYCPRCGFMNQVAIFSSRRAVCSGHRFSKGRCCTDLPPTRRPRLIPVRFICICQEGHIQDFPFMEWAHGGTPENGEHILRLRAGRSSGALSGIEISCSCGANKSMAGAFNDKAIEKATGTTCSGDRPWLGEEAHRANVVHCGQPLIVVQKGASNVYFPHVRSSIYLPQWQNDVDRHLVEVLEKNWMFLTSGVDDETLQRMRFELVAERHFKGDKEFYTNKLIEAAETRLSAGTVQNARGDSEEEYRKMEYDAITGQTGGENQDFFVEQIQPHEYTHGSGGFEGWFNLIGLLHKLRETRAFVGFSRWLPNNSKSIEELKSFIRLGNTIDWLPAIVVRGEGVFFDFSRPKLEDWGSRPDVLERVNVLATNYNSHRLNRGQEPRSITPTFVLLHTFAHVVINRFSFECGYGSSALRERLYCNIENPDQHMAGVLIYTASGDSEGSLGGLVRQGQPGNLERIVLNAIESSRWCSSDPVCIDSHGQGPNSCNLAACHNCALLPETCCEEMNMLLDRGVLIGALDNTDLGYFN